MTFTTPRVTALPACPASSERLNETAPNAPSLEPPLQMKLPEKDGTVRRRSLHPADIFAGQRDDPNLRHPPLACKTFMLPNHVQTKCFDNLAHALEVEPLAKGKILRTGGAGNHGKRFAHRRNLTDTGLMPRCPVNRIGHRRRIVARQQFGRTAHSAIGDVK